MCFGGGRATRNAAAAAEAEANRQAEIEKTRLAEEAAAAKAEADRRAAAEQARWEAMFAQQKTDAETLRAQLKTQEDFRLSEAAKTEEARKLERDTEAKRQADERAKAEAAATAKAEQLRSYNASRQQLIDQTVGGVNSAFAPYDDGFYGNFENQYVGFYKPQIDEQYTDARRQSIFGYANRGTLDSTAAARGFGRLDQARTGAEADIAQRAKNASMGLRSQVEGQRSNLLSSVFGALNSAPTITADNVGESNAALSQTSAALNNPLRNATGFNPTLPSLDPLQNPFRVPGAVRPQTRYGGVGADPYTRSTGTSGRLVA